MNNEGKKLKAFTLAEVLITLGVIGVVAAMTIPVLVQNHRKHFIETSLKKFYTNINQAIALSEADNGAREGWDLRTTELSSVEWYNRYLNKYIQNLKVDYEEATNTTTVFLTDGSAFSFHKYAWTFYPEAKNIDYCTTAGNDCTGIKAFTFQYAPSQTFAAIKYLYHKGVEPYQFAWIDNNESTLKTSNEYGCKKEDTTYGHAYCTAIIQRNGWRIPEDYPFKF